ncbi:MAG: chorismate synthase [Corallococcus sp.]|nr:chorismate synthase [Bacillota bacterium]MCM1533145.1 chorismate synthase [Corallococcus sp.]
MITFEFYGESHGKGYGGVIKGLLNGFTFDVAEINKQLAARKTGYGRSSRQTFRDEAAFDGFGDTVTVNGELRFFVANACAEKRSEITALRSGHADVVGQARFENSGVRALNEIASARNSVCYVVLGAICRQYLKRFNIFTYHYVESIGGVSSRKKYRFGVSEQEEHFALLHCADPLATQRMMKKIDVARENGDSLGGAVTVGACGVPMGLGEILPYEERLDARISANLMGIPSVKGISFGIAEKYGILSGKECYDKLEVNDGKIVYATNNCGGIVSGITNGRDILCRLTVKPVPTVKGAVTYDSVTLKETEAHYERADTCVVPNVGVIAENILAYVLLNQLIKQGKA